MALNFRNAATVPRVEYSRRELIIVYHLSPRARRTIAASCRTVRRQRCQNDLEDSTLLAFRREKRGTVATAATRRVICHTGGRWRARALFSLSPRPWRHVCSSCARTLFFFPVHPNDAEIMSFAQRPSRPTRTQHSGNCS